MKITIINRNHFLPRCARMDNLNLHTKKAHEWFLSSVYSHVLLKASLVVKLFIT